MGWCDSWGRLLAASGVVAITYTNREPASDARSLIGHLMAKRTDLGIEGALSLFACSGNAPVALALAMDRSLFQCRSIALCYPYTLDARGHSEVRTASQQFRFANPCEHSSVDDLPSDVPFLIARAGRDRMTGLNASLDRFVTAAIERNLPMTFINHSEGGHAFDLDAEDLASLVTVQRILSFLGEGFVPVRP